MFFSSRIRGLGRVEACLMECGRARTGGFRGGGFRSSASQVTKRPAKTGRGARGRRLEEYGPSRPGL